MAKKKTMVDFSEKEAFDRATDFEYTYNPYVTSELQEFMKRKAKKHGVTPSMAIPSFLTVTSNLMGKAEMKFTEDWSVQQNLYVLNIAPKGSGKTHVNKIFLDPLTEIEKEDKEVFDAQRKRKRGRDEEDGEEISEDEYAKKFHEKTRVIENVTPEALTCTLAYGSSELLIKSDEFKGFFDKCIERANNTSAICSAHSGEEIRDSTVGKGELCVYSSRLSIFGSMQPGPLKELLNSQKEDHQGLWDRFILIPGNNDPDHVFDNYLEDIPHPVDVQKLMRCVRDNHKEDRVYRPDKDAMEKFKECYNALGEIEEKGDYGGETMGMTKKCFTNLQKLTIILSAIREAFEQMKADPDDMPNLSFTVKVTDVEIAHDIIKQHILTYKCFKLSLAKELGEYAEEDVEGNEDITEDMVLEASHKVRKLYEKADENKQVLLSQVKRCKLFPPKTRMELFITALEKYKIAKVVTLETTGNNKKPRALQLTTQTDNPETVRLFNLLYDLNRAKNELFDPLEIFHEED